MFIGLPGVLGGESLDYQRSREFTGMSLNKAVPGRRFSKLFFNPNLHLWLDLQKLPLISEYWISDTFPVRAVIGDTDAEPLAWFDQSKDVAVAQKQVASGRSILFSAMAPPKADILTALFKMAGVHVYYDQPKSKDSFYCAGNLIAVFSRVGGKKKINLPGKVEVVMDVFSGEILGEDCDSIIFTLPENKVSTKILFVGSKKTAQAYRRLSKDKSEL